MKSIKMSTQLILGFSFVTLITVIVGLISIFNMGNLAQQSSIIYLENLKPIVELEKKLARLESHRVKVFTLLIVEDMDIVEKSVQQLIAEMPELDEVLTSTEGLNLSEEQQAEWEQIGLRWEEVKKSYLQVFTLTQNYVIEIALDILSGQNAQQFAALEENFESLIEQKLEESEEAFHSSLEIDQTSNWITLGTLGVGGLLAIILSSILIRGILRKVGGDPATIEQVAQEVARGNLNLGTTQIESLTGIYYSLHEMVASLNGALRQVITSSQLVSSGSTQIAVSSQALASGASQQASAIEEISASMSEISSQLDQNVQNASQASQLSSSVRHSAQEGNQKMQEMLGSMTDISEASQNISKIIKVIDEIAFQTNLLALNAAVEAARAGVHGKGFAVVANEVRNLAVRSANVAKETSDLIEGAVHKIGEGREVANVTAQAFEKIVDGIEKVSDLMGEIDAASKEQASGIGQINQGLSQLEQVTQQNAANSEEGAANAEDLSQQSAVLQTVVSRFNLEDEQAPSEEELPPLEASEPPTKALPSAPMARAENPSKVIALDDEEFGKF